MANINIVNEIEEVKKHIPTPEHMLGKGLQQPFSNTNSGARKIMFGTQSEHALSLLHPEPPLVATGYENKFGDYSSSFIKAESDYVVLSKISKFSEHPDHHYYLIIMDNCTKKLDVIERISYHHITESYGYLYNNSYMDDLKEDDIILKGDIVRKSLAYDDYNNRQEGVNLIAGYLSCNRTMEDGIVISESARHKLTAPLLKKVTIIINDNDIMLNLYGDDNVYKSFPDIGENVKGGILCATRREKKEDCLYSQSYQKLKSIMMSDDKFSVKGKVIDIDVFCNNPENIDSTFYNTQISKYYKDNMRFARDFVSTVQYYLDSGYKMSYDLQKIFYTNQRIINGDQFIKDRPFSNIIMNITLLEENLIEIGDKLSDRYGGKGVVADILPDELMPTLDNNERLEIIFNSSTCVNRLNAGQLFEVSLNHISQRILEYMEEHSMHTEDALQLYGEYIDSITEDQAQFVKSILMNYDEDELSDFLKSVMDNGIMLSIKPISESMDIDRLNNLYKKFTMAKPYVITVPIRDSNGNIRYIKARREMYWGKKYIYRLKQYAEEKFSVTSLSSTNIKNENTRSKANKDYKALYPKTPIRFGEMETGDMSHLGMEIAIINLMLYSSSPHGRRLVEKILIDDPFDINIQLDDNAKNRNVEILNAYLKTMGLRLVFKKIPKNMPKMIYRPMFTRGPGLKKMIAYSNPDEYFDVNKYYAEMEKESNNPKRIFSRRPFEIVEVPKGDK